MRLFRVILNLTKVAALIVGAENSKYAGCARGSKPAVGSGAVIVGFEHLHCAAQFLLPSTMGLCASVPVAISKRHLIEREVAKSITA